MLLIKKVLSRFCVDFTFQLKKLTHLPIQRYLEPYRDHPRLPPKLASHDLTLVFQLNELLLHVFYPDFREAYTDAPARMHDKVITYQEHEIELLIYLRKSVAELLAEVSKRHELILFTTGIPSYTNLVLKEAELLNYFHHIRYQDHCRRLVVPDEEIDEFIKDMDDLERDPAKLVYFDCNPFSFWLSPDNCRPLPEYLGDEEEEGKGLKALANQISNLAGQVDIREQLRNKFKLAQVLEDCKITRH